MRLLSCGFLLAGLVLIATSNLGRAGDKFELEPGFKLLFNGTNLDGWKTKGKNESLNGKTEAFNNRFKVTDGKIIIDPAVKGIVVIETAAELKGDLHIKFEFFPSKGCNNDLYLRGLKFDIVPNTKNAKLDEWNQLEIIAKGNTVEYKCNGVTMRTDKAKVDSSTFGIRAEFGPMQIRRLRIQGG